MNVGSLSLVYGVVALLSALLLAGYLLFEKKKNAMFMALFSCITIANCGYFLLSVCNSLAVAKLANGISYFGSAFSLLVMMLIIRNVCQLRGKKWITWLFIAISFAAFALAASGDWLGLYYRAVSIERVDGVTHLVKDYGPLHSVYAVYLAGYILVMLSTIVYAAKTKRLTSLKYTAFLFVAVLLNVGVWLVEQALVEEFEFLSISYIVTGVLLLLIYNMLCEYGIIDQNSGVISVQALARLNAQEIHPGALPPGMEDMFQGFAEKARMLTSAERRILGYYMDGYEATDIPDLAYISIHTVKKHNHSIYQKLEVSSRDELMLYIELFRCCGRLDELIGQEQVTEL